MTGSYTDKNVKIGKKYYYKVVTYKNISGGKMLRSAYSGVKGITAAPNTPILSFIIKYTINWTINQAESAVF